MFFDIKELRESTGMTQKSFAQTDSSFQKIAGKGGTFYYYDETRKLISDMRGNKIYIEDDLSGVKEQNLVLYLEDLFRDFYAIQERFNRDCRYDKEEDILWS